MQSLLLKSTVFNTVCIRIYGIPIMNHEDCCKMVSRKGYHQSTTVFIVELLPHFHSGAGRLLVFIRRIIIENSEGDHFVATALLQNTVTRSELIPF